MQLHETTEVCEATSTEQANELMANGWKLLAVTTIGGPGGHKPCYVLGKKELSAIAAAAQAAQGKVLLPKE